jgi:hypothetical protein
MQSHCVDGATVGCMCRGLQSQSSSDTDAEDSRYWAGNVCCVDCTGRMPERCVEASLVFQMLILLKLDLLMMLTWRPQRYEPAKALRFARARPATTI